VCNYRVDKAGSATILAFGLVPRIGAENIRRLLFAPDRSPVARDLGAVLPDRISCGFNSPSHSASVRATAEEAASFGDLLRWDEIDGIAVQSQARDQPGNVTVPLVEDAPDH
jgi:hypothetical protein